MMVRLTSPCRPLPRLIQACLFASAIWLSGCSGEDPSTEPSAAGSTETSVPPSGVETPVAADGGTAVNTALAANDPRTKWIGEIPYDVFFDRPLDVVRDQAPVGAPPGETVPPPESGTDPVPTAADPMPSPAPSGAGGVDWASVVSAELLNEAVTDIRNRLTANLQTLAAYNSNWEAIALDGHTLAALAAVLEKHPDEVSWRENAKYVRDLGYEIYINADGTGRAPHTATQEAFENAMTILNGGPPPDIDSDDLTSFADVVDRSMIMEQVEKTFNWLKADVNTETRLKEDADRVAREASVLAAFGTVILDEGYDFSDEPDYQAFVQEFVTGNREMASASQSELTDFESFQSGRNVVQTSCGVCHQKYKDADTGF